MIEVTASDRKALRLPWRGLLANKGHEFWIKATGRRIHGQGMIAAHPEVVSAGFGALRDDTFDEYNYPQVWVESRQIPQAVHQRIPTQNARILDLGCGPGSSTRILCHFARPDWEITGYDFIPHYIEKAGSLSESGAFTNKSGQIIRPHFECQSIAEPLLRKNKPVPDESIDMALSGGVVGLYLNQQQTEALLSELKRVIRPDGYIALDSGPSIPYAAMRALAEIAGFSFEGVAKSCIIEPRPKLIFKK